MRKEKLEEFKPLENFIEIDSSSYLPEDCDGVLIAYPKMVDPVARHVFAPGTFMYAPASTSRMD